MGNTPSSERPIRAPQKLSKPRVGNHASSNANTTVKDSNNRLNATRSNVSIHGQHPNSYNVGPPPPLPHDAAETPHIAVNGVPGEIVGAEVLDTDDEAPLSRRSKRLSGLIRSVSSKSQPEGVARGQSNGSPSKMFIGMVRPKSMVQASTKSPSPTSQSRPSSSDGTIGGSSGLARQQYPPESRHPDETTDSFEALRQVVSPESITTARLHLDSTPYLPRRSSFGQTPGAATRLLPLPTEPKPLNKPDFRRSFPLPPSAVNHSSPRTMMNRRQSMPVTSTSKAADESVRASTPSESDYRQLGGMRFGSLRITNDTSAPTDQGLPVRYDTNQWAITQDQRAGKQPKEMDSTAFMVGDAVEAVAGVPTLNADAALEQHQAQHLIAPSPAVHATSSEAPEAIADSSISSHSSEDRSSDEHDQRRQISVPVSNLDSGYASSSSIGSGTKAADDTSVDGQANGGSPQSLTGQDGSSDLHADSISSHELSQENIGLATESEQAADVQRQHSLRARGSAMLSSLLSRKSRDSRSMDQSASRSRASSTHSRGASLPDAPMPDDDATDVDASPRKSDDRAGQPSKLKRLLKSRRRSLPQETTYIVQDTTPMPSDAEDKLREHGFQIVQAAGEKPPLRMEQSRDTLKTIISVGSKEDKDEFKETRSFSENEGDVHGHEPEDSHRSVRKPSSINRTKSLLYPKPSSRQAKSTLRKSMPVAMRPTPKVDAVDDDLAETVQIWGYEAHMASIANIRHMAGNSAFDQAFVPMSRDNGAYPAAVNMPPPPQDRPSHKSHSGWKHQPLRTRYSAPDFLETVCEPASPGGIDSTQQKPPKTPPPVSLRTRGSKKSRRRARTQHHSHRPHTQYVPPVPLLDMQESAGEPDQDFQSSRRLSQSLRSFPVQPPQRPAPGSHHSYGGYSPMQDQMHFSKPRYYGHHGPWNDGNAGYHHSPGMRVHHSYNAPAHRGHPVQSS